MAGVTVRITARVMVGKVIGVVMVVNMAMAAVRKGVCMSLRAGGPALSVSRTGNRALVESATVCGCAWADMVKFGFLAAEGVKKVE